MSTRVERPDWGREVLLSVTDSGSIVILVEPKGHTGERTRPVESPVTDVVTTTSTKPLLTRQKVGPRPGLGVP